MVILPAIDIKDGNCVRLFRGDYSTAEKVADNFLDTAKSFEKAGAEWIHMVDLDGAKEGRPVNTKIYTDVAEKTNLKVEVGGGIRNIETIDEYLKMGISRVILGSVALKDPQLVKEAVEKFGSEKIVVGIDAKNGLVATEGWLETSNVNYIDLANKMISYGVKYFIFTDISKDGTLSGVNADQLKALYDGTRGECKIIASGGVHTIEDIRICKDMGLYGTICGKSIYTGSLDLKKAIELASMKSFLTCFYILDHCFSINSEDDLGGILGQMDPDMLVDGMPIDMADLEDWEDVCPDYPSSADEFIKRIDEFLIKIGLNFEKTRDLIKTPEILSYIKTAEAKAEVTCKKHDY